MTIERDGKTYELTDAEMIEAHHRIRERLIEQEFLLRYLDSDAVDELAEALRLSDSEREILTDVLFVPNSAFMHGLSDEVMNLENWETYEDSYSDMLHRVLEDSLQAYFTAYRN